MKNMLTYNKFDQNIYFLIHFHIHTHITIGFDAASSPFLSKYIIHIYTYC